MDTNIKLKKPYFDYHQLLLSWFSPSFPVGSFNFSHGLEAAIEYEFVYDKISLEEWIKHLIINGTGKTDSILLTNAYNGEAVNELAFALCPSKERWIETSNLGKAFCKNIRENWGYKIDKNFVYYKLTFNGTATVFLKVMSSYNYNFDTQNKLWILK